MPSSNNLLKVSALRKFNGGLNVLDNDLSLKTHFATQLENLYTAPDGSLRLRYGVKQFTALGGEIDLAIPEQTTHNEPTHAVYNVRSFPSIVSGTPSLMVQLYFTVMPPITGGDVIIISGFTGTIASTSGGTGFDSSIINGTRTVDSVGASYITVVIPYAAAVATGSCQGNIAFSVTYTAPGAGTTALLSGNVVNMTYFQTKLICVTDVGEVVSINSAGVPLIIWNEAIALASGNAAGWVGNTFASFVAFNDVLLICNGVDKPLRVDNKSTLVCDYIKDPISGNVNTPICRYVTVVGDYVIMAGDPEHVDRVYFSNKSTYTTWYLDTAPNDATFYDTGKVVNTFDQTITGINRFRDKLLVFFTDLTLVGTVGGYTNGVHFPVFDDTLQGHGCIAHNSAIALGYDFLMCDMIGVPSLKRAVATTSFTPERVSVLIDPEIRTRLVQLSVQTQLDQVFALNNKRDSQYMLFVPNADSPTESLCYTFTNNAQLQISAWSVYRGWNFRCGCVSATNRLFFAKNKTIYVYGAYEDEFFDDGTSHTPINFIYESPWMSLESDQLTKLLRYIDFQTKGSAQFTCSILLDNKVYDVDGNFDTQATMQFTGGDSGGYGVEDGPVISGESPYGGGRRTNDSRTYALNARFKSIKLRITGAAKKPLRLVSITLSYLLGSLR